MPPGDFCKRLHSKCLLYFFFKLLESSSIARVCLNFSNWPCLLASASQAANVPFCLSFVVEPGLIALLSARTYVLFKQKMNHSRLKDRNLNIL